MTFRLTKLPLTSLIRWQVTLLICFGTNISNAQSVKIPAVYSGIKSDAVGNIYLEAEGGQKYVEITEKARYTLSRMKGNPQGTPSGISFDFGLEDMEGILYYGFIPYGDSRHPHPVYFKYPEAILGGKAHITLKDNMVGKYDMVNWQEKGYGTLGYRVTNTNGTLLYDGIVTFRTDEKKGFVVDATVIEGPTVNKLTEGGATVVFETNVPVAAKVTVNEQTFGEESPKRLHAIEVSGLEPNTEYTYEVAYGQHRQQYSLKTAPTAGSRQPFTFAYASDSRNGKGGGERNLYGTNMYVMKKIMALATQQGVSFMQFSGDLIDGYLTDPEEMDLQYANWKRAVQPFNHYFPMYISMGNHEALSRSFSVPEAEYPISVDRFPFGTESGEAVFARNFVLPENGPVSEDGTSYDPDPDEADFPPYRENVYYYTFDNVAVVVLNSNYFYAPSTSTLPSTGGGLHAYIMDRQLAWLEQKVADLEKNKAIDHIFITQHTPFFPNGGHVKDDMWYNGNNSYRTFVAGKPMEKGIIERRDELLDILVNQSEKVVAIMSGDEHNYALTRIGPDTPIYPIGYPKKKRLKLKRTIHQINNGAAGAPYYAQEITPWSGFVSGFTTQNALVLIDVDGKSVKMRVHNPDTLEEIQEKTLR
ncbi:MAG: hypothetical protein AAGI38_01700 [Bacteroidota bacterium]